MAAVLERQAMGHLRMAIGMGLRPRASRSGIPWVCQGTRRAALQAVAHVLTGSPNRICVGKVRYAFTGRGRRPFRCEPVLRHESRPRHDRTRGNPEGASVCRTDAQDPRRAFLIASSIAASLCVSSQRTTGVVGVRADGQPSCREIPVRPLDRALLNFGIVKRQ